MLFFKINGALKDDFSALCSVTVLISFNILTIIGYVRILILGLESILLPKFYSVLITLLVGILLYFIFLFRGRFNKKYEDFKTSALNGSIGTIYTVVYIGITLISLALLAVV